jgi:hypothetical protein
MPNASGTLVYYQCRKVTGTVNVFMTKRMFY